MEQVQVKGQARRWGERTATRKSTRTPLICLPGTLYTPPHKMCQESSQRAIQCKKPEISQAHRCSHSLLPFPFSCMTARGCRQLREERSIKKESLSCQQLQETVHKAGEPLRHCGSWDLNQEFKRTAVTTFSPLAINIHACVLQDINAHQLSYSLTIFLGSCKARKLKKKESRKQK